MRKPKMQLEATKEDLQRAVSDALYAQRLKERGVSPFKVFIELNEIARKIRAASETPQNIYHGPRRSGRARREKRPSHASRQARQ